MVTLTGVVHRTYDGGGYELTRHISDTLFPSAARYNCLGYDGVKPGLSKIKTQQILQSAFTQREIYRYMQFFIWFRNKYKNDKQQYPETCPNLHNTINFTYMTQVK